MTINSAAPGSERKLTISGTPHDSTVTVRGLEEGHRAAFVINVDPAELARELSTVPGLTVTYEKQFPTEPGVYQDRVGDIWALGSEPDACLIPLGTSSNGIGWEPINEPASFAPNDYAPFVRLIPASDADL